MSLESKYLSRHMSMLASLACAAFSVSRVHGSVFLKMFEEEILAIGMGNPYPIPELTVSQRPDALFGCDLESHFPLAVPSAGTITSVSQPQLLLWPLLPFSCLTT